MDTTKENKPIETEENLRAAGFTLSCGVSGIPSGYLYVKGEERKIVSGDDKEVVCSYLQNPAPLTEEQKKSRYES